MREENVLPKAFFILTVLTVTGCAVTIITSPKKITPDQIEKQTGCKPVDVSRNSPPPKPPFQKIVSGLTADQKETILVNYIQELHRYAVSEHIRVTTVRDQQIHLCTKTSP